jgi:hypothetical protein
MDMHVLKMKTPSIPSYIQSHYMINSNYALHIHIQILLVLIQYTRYTETKDYPLDSDLLNPKLAGHSGRAV